MRDAYRYWQIICSFLPAGNADIVSKVFFSMAWKTLSLHFKQTLEGGYRYLDQCGEFMLDAVESLDFVPGDIKPTGAKLEFPEQGLSAGVDAGELVVAQELSDDEGEFFLKMCISLAGLVQNHFCPTRIAKNGFAWKSYWALGSAEAVLASSLKLGDSFHTELGKCIGMVPAHKKLDCNFGSGSMDFHVLIHPVTFEKIALNRHNANFKASAAHKRRIDRLNKFTERFNMDLGHVLLMELDLMESDPPEDSLTKHFDELKRKNKLLREKFNLT